MVVSAHQPLFMPWLGFFDKINKVDLFVIADDVQFTSAGWIRKNRIKGNNNIIDLIVPIKNKKHNIDKPINVVQIDPSDKKWRISHLKSFKWHYSNAPYFDLIFNELERIYSQTDYSLCELNLDIIKTVCRLMGITVPIVTTSMIGAVGGKSDGIIDICKKTNADTFLLGMGGSKSYADRGYIESYGIKLLDQEFAHPVYPQLHGDFVPNLSIIDLLFNCGPQGIEYLSKENKILSNT